MVDTRKTLGPSVWQRGLWGIVNPIAKEKQRKTEAPGLSSSQSDKRERLTEAIALFTTRSDLYVFHHKPRLHSLDHIPFFVAAIYEYGVWN